MIQSNDLNAQRKRFNDLENDLNVQRKRDSKSQLCQEWRVCEIFQYFRPLEKNYSRLNGPGEFFQKN